jgi:outer membrane translocation and assembly module TamA
LLSLIFLFIQFVYPFTIEPHVLTLESSRRSTLAAHTTRREEYLRSRADEKERRKRDALRRIAPGFEPEGHLLVPTKRSSVIAAVPATSPQPPKSVMEDLVDQLAALDSASSSSAARGS